MMWRKLLAVLAVSAAIITPLTVASGSSAGADPKPSCHSATLAENSGNGPTYRHVHFCDALNPGVNYLIVDGGPLKNGATVFGSHAAPSAATLKAKTSLSSLAGCWGHTGLQLSGLIAYECIAQPSNDGGAVYWSANEANQNFDKHPGSGLLWTEGSMVQPTSDSNPPNPYKDEWVGIAHPNGVFCTVVNPGVDDSPTMCETTTLLENQNPASCTYVASLPGQPQVCFTLKVMDARRLGSYRQFIKSELDSNLPKCAETYDITSDQSQCDIDS